MPLETDFQNFDAYLAEFEYFLKSKEVFSRVSVPHAPALSLGGVLFLQRTLTVRQNQLSPNALTEFARLERQLTEQLRKWTVHTEQKAAREVSQRLNIWGSAFEDFPENYLSSIHQRVYLELLLPLCNPASPTTTQYQEHLQSLDRRLRIKFNVGEFILEKDLQVAFPPEAFWFLYGKAKGATR